MILAHAAPEEPLAAVAAGGTIVLPCGPVPADGAILAEDGGGARGRPSGRRRRQAGWGCGGVGGVGTKFWGF